MKLSIAASFLLVTSSCNAAAVPISQADVSTPFQRVHPREYTVFEDTLQKRAGPPLIEAKIPKPSKGPVKDMMIKAKDFAGTKKGRLIIGGMVAKAAFSGGFLYYMQQNQPNRPRGSAFFAPTPNTANQQISLTKKGGALNFSSSYATSNANTPPVARPVAVVAASPSS